MFYPMFLDLTNRPVLVVGGGPVAERKVEALLEAGACVRLVSPEITSRLNDFAANGRITILRRCFDPVDVDGVHLVFSATDDAATQKEVAAAAASRNVLVNTADQ